MAGIALYPHQLDAVKRMKNGCILNGDVGSGKSRTGLAYYYILQGGEIGTENYVEMVNPKPLYIITTARKRDTLEWEGELGPFLLSTNENLSRAKVVVDSWNNIKKYKDITDAFFIFDEDRVTGYGAWVKAFLKITKSNDWILLSATPGDTWQDYIPVFIANGFYKNKTHFNQEHVVFDHHVQFPKVSRYLNTRKLTRLRDRILVDMDYAKRTNATHKDVTIIFDRAKYREVTRTRWNPYKEKPVESGSELCYVWRRIVNSDFARQNAILELLEAHPKAIVFYNFDYELDILKNLPYEEGTEISEWNGHMHQPIPESERWVYLVQYTAGSEGWNCISTDTIIFFSQTYSYKTLKQACGRIDRMNTPFLDLYYYHLKSKAPIDIAIDRALKNKKNFNETRYVRKMEGGGYDKSISRRVL